MISKDYQLLQLLRTHLKILFNSRKIKPRDRIHVSDIFPVPALRKAFYARIVKDYELTVKDIDYFVRGESSEYVPVGLAGIGISQDEFLFGGNPIARPDIMTGVQSQRTDYQEMVSTHKGK